MVKFKNMFNYKLKLFGKILPMKNPAQKEFKLHEKFRYPLFITLDQSSVEDDLYKCTINYVYK